MKRVTWIVALLAGCAGPGTLVQQRCEAQHPGFVAMYQCTYDGIRAAAPQVLSDDRAKLYLLRGEQLAGQVYQGRITDIDARVAWQQMFVDLKAAKTQEELALANAAAATAQAARAAVPTPSQCVSTRIGSSVYTSCQ